MKIGFVLVQDGEYFLWNNKVLIFNTKEEAECFLEEIEGIGSNMPIMAPEVYYGYNFNDYIRFENIIDDFIKALYSDSVSSLS